MQVWERKELQVSKADFFLTVKFPPTDSDRVEPSSVLSVSSVLGEWRKYDFFCFVLPFVKKGFFQTDLENKKKMWDSKEDLVK